MLAGLSLVSYALRTNISVTARLMMPELGLSNVQMGQVFSSFLIGYSLFQIPAGALGDRFGPRRVLAAAACWWGIATWLTGLLPGALAFGSGTLAVLLMVRFTLGVAEAPTYPVAGRAVANWFEPSERALANSLVITGLSLGSALTPPVISWVMTAFGWRAAMHASGTAAIVVALCWWAYARDSPSHDRLRTNSSERSLDQPVAPEWRTLLKNRSLFFLSVSYGCLVSPLM